MPILVALFLFLVLPAVALAWLPSPFLWISVSWALFFFARVRPNRHRRRGPVFLYVGVALLAFAGVETFFLVLEGRKVQRTEENEGPSLGQGHEILGYAPTPGARQHAHLEFEGETIFDVDYTIGEDGLRIAPPVEKPPTDGSILFFGCSYTFGEGVEDDEALPYRTGVLLDGRYRPYNFAFGGYGPHHMLASIEHGRVETRVKEPPRFAVYWAISSHVGRAAGPKPWDPRGPRYVLQQDGSVRFDGQYDDPRPEKPLSFAERCDRSLRRGLRKSHLLRTVVDRRVETAEDYALWVGIVAESQRRLQERYPGLEFHVILWDCRHVDWEPMLEALEAGGFAIHRASRILPDFDDDLYRWLLSRHDRHPNARTDAALAEYVARSIVGDGAR